MGLEIVLSSFPPLEDGGACVAAEELEVRPLDGGLINDTFALGRGYVLQRLHRIFAAEVNLDIAQLTRRLRQGGVPAPEIICTRDGRPWVTIVAPDRPDLEGTWRILTRLPGKTLHKVRDQHQARSAGRLVARFHGALLGIEHTFAFSRPGAHDTDGHLRRLAESLERHKDHRLHTAVATLEEKLAARWQAWGTVPDLPSRIVHGDLKISNLLFDEDHEAIGVVDLDTMAWSGVDIELGDALRSWCNPTTEDDPLPRFDADTFAAAIGGWLDGASHWVTDAELSAIVPAVERICLELAARFAADALDESYFGWDSSRYASRGDHNLRRARSQFELALDVASQYSVLFDRLGAELTRSRAQVEGKRP